MFSRRLFGASFLIGGPYRFVKSSVRRCLGGNYGDSKPYYGIEVFQNPSISVPINSRALAGMEASRSGSGGYSNDGGGSEMKTKVRYPSVSSFSLAHAEEPRAEIKYPEMAPVRAKKACFHPSRPAAVSSCGGLRGGAANKWHRR